MPNKQNRSTTSQTTTNTGTTNEQGTTQEFGSNEQNQQGLVTGSGQQVQTPATEEEVLAAARARCPEIAELEGREKKADPRLLEFVTRFEAMEQGWTPEAQALWVEFLAAAKDIAVESGDTSGKDVRTLYDGPFTEMMNGWIAANEASDSGMSMEVQAERAYMYRKVLRELSRDLMTDTNAVKVLRARDMIKHGSPFGPSFASLFEKNGGENDADAAYGKIIGSSTSHDKAASKIAKGGGSGGGGSGGGGFIKPKL